MNDNHQNIDDLVRKRLQALPPATPPQGGWAALQRELDGDADLVLRNALTGLAAGAAPIGWEALERKIDPQTTADQQFADQLNGLKPAPPAGWETLAARLDRENDLAVDTIVTDGLAKTTPTTTSGWAALAARLELIGWRRGTVAAWKITECCLLLSLLLLFVRFGPTTPSNPTFVELAEGFPLPFALAQNEGHPEEVTSAWETQSNVPAVEAVETTKPVAVATEAKLPKQKATTGKSLTPLAPYNSINTIDLALTRLPGSPDFIVLSQVSVPTLKETDVTLPREEVYLPENVSMLNINKLKTSLYPPSPALTLPRRDDTEPIYYFLDGFVSPVDLNQVITPDTDISEFNIGSGRRVSYGKSAGLMLDVLQGNNGLQFGFVYSRRSYIPTELRWLQEDNYAPTELFFSGGYTRFVYDAVEVQFNYKRTLVETEKWRFSGKVGMGLNLVAFADFADQDRFVREFNDFLEWYYSRPQPFEPGSGGGSRSPSDEQQLKEPAAGFLEGGGVFDNSSLYFNGGIVIERRIDQRWSVYVAPSFGRAIYLSQGQGQGPYKDRINPAGIRFGSRYHFGGK